MDGVRQRLLDIEDAVAVLAVDDLLASPHTLLEMGPQREVTQRARTVDNLGDRCALLAFEQPQKPGAVLGLDFGLDLLGVIRQLVDFLQEIFLALLP